MNYRDHLYTKEDGSEIVVCGSPFQLSREISSKIVDQCELLWKCSEQAVRELSAHSAPPTGFEHHGKYWAEIRSSLNYPTVLFFCRFDFKILSPSTVAFLELNTNCPAGAAFYSHWRDLCPDQSTAEVGKRAHPLDDPTFFVRSLIELARHRKSELVSRKLRVAIVNDAANFTLELPLIRKRFLEVGTECEIIHVAQIRYLNGQLCDAQGERLDLIYCKTNPVQSTSSGWTPGQQQNYRQFTQGIRNSDTSVINTFAGITIAEDKAFLGYVADEWHHMWLPGIASQLRQSIPRTSIFSHLTDHERTDLVQCRERWVIKPRQESRGRGVVCGRYVTQAVWLKSIAAIEDVQDRFVAQHYVGTAYQPPGSDVQGDEGTTSSALLINGKVVGIFNRIGKYGIHNVANGGRIQVAACEL